MKSYVKARMSFCKKDIVYAILEFVKTPFPLPSPGLYYDFQQESLRTVFIRGQMTTTDVLILRYLLYFV